MLFSSSLHFPYAPVPMEREPCYLCMILLIKKRKLESARETGCVVVEPEVRRLCWFQEDGLRQVLQEMEALFEQNQADV